MNYCHIIAVLTEIEKKCSWLNHRFSSGNVCSVSGVCGFHLCIIIMYCSKLTTDLKFTFIQLTHLLSVMFVFQVYARVFYV